MKYLVTGVVALALASSAYAADYTLTIKDHKFSPEKLEVKADEKFTVTVKNQDSTPAEFESEDLKREKVVKGNSEAKVAFGALKAGEYKFFDDFHEDTTKGVIIAK